MLNGYAANLERKLQQHLLLSSSDVEEVRRNVAGVLNDHWLEPQVPTLSARLYGAKSQDIQICMLEYGGAVTVETQPADDFLIIQSALRGGVDVSCAQGEWRVRPGQGLILPSEVALKLDWDEHTSQLLIKIPIGRLKSTYESLAGHPSIKPLQFNREMLLDSDSGMSWNVMLEYFCTQISDNATGGNRVAVKVAEEALIGHLLCSQCVVLQEGHAEPRPNIAPKHVRRAREFMEASLQDPIALQDIADSAGVSIRSLSRAYHEQYNVSPMTALRALRLDRIREDLARGDSDENVAQIAFRWGYSHLGRFAAAYRERFGEAPSETLRKSRRSMH